MGKMDGIPEESPPLANSGPPVAPPLPVATTSYRQKSFVKDGRFSNMDAAARNLWDRLFDEAYRADVAIYTDHGGMLYAHASILVSFLPD